jgi:hypothetical protein
MKFWNFLGRVIDQLNSFSCNSKGLSNFCKFFSEGHWPIEPLHMLVYGNPYLDLRTFCNKYNHFWPIEYVNRCSTVSAFCWSKSTHFCKSKFAANLLQKRTPNKFCVNERRGALKSLFLEDGKERVVNFWVLKISCQANSACVTSESGT